MDETVLEQVAKATGLPEDLVLKKLKNWIVARGKSPQGMTLEDLREVMVSLMQDIFVDVKEGEHPAIKIENN